MMTRYERIARQYGEKMAREIGGKTICTSAKRYLRWVPHTAAAGDIICIFSGSEVPFFLRADGTDHYTLIGECYLHGIMDGEAIAIGDLVKQSFKIR
jgi:hypothetical protein